MAADGMFQMLMEMYPDGPPEDGLPAPLAAIAQDAISNEPEAEPLTEQPSLEPSSKVRMVRGKTPCAGTGFSSASAVSAQQIGLHQQTYNRLRRWGVPRVFLLIIGMVLAATQGSQGSVDAVEGFSGVGRIDTAFKDSEHHSHGFKIEHQKCFESITTDECFCTLVYWVLCMSTKGLAHMAALCSTWVWVSRASTGRSAVKPEGFDTKAVKEANCMIERSVLLLLLCKARGCHLILEQPASSVMEFMPCVHHLKRCVGTNWACIFAYMGMFGHDCWKPTHLYSSSPSVQALKRKLDKNSKYAAGWSSSKCVRVRCDTRGMIHVDGAEGLKQSQVYPKQYGDEVFKLWKDTLKHETVDDSEVEDVDEDACMQLVEAVGWKWGILDDVLACMKTRDA